MSFSLLFLDPHRVLCLSHVPFPIAHLGMGLAMGADILTRSIGLCLSTRELLMESKSVGHPVLGLVPIPLGY